MVLRIRGHRQIALAHIYADDLPLGLWRRVGYLHFQTHQQVELLARLVIPELGRADAGAVLDEGHMPVIARVGHDHPPIQGQDAHLLLSLEAVVVPELVGQRGRDILAAPGPSP